MIHIKRPAVIDIGSNSVRLVIYQDFSPAATIFYNEKFSCKLGKFTSNNKLSDVAKAATIRAMIRFKTICEANQVSLIKAIATAALRDSSDGLEFAQEIQNKTGIRIEVISGKNEAFYAARGVLYKIPHANGIVGDLGGGSLELCFVQNRDAIYTSFVSMPVGILRLQNDISEEFDLKKYSYHLDNVFDTYLEFQCGMTHDMSKNFYCVGGAWRALMNIYMLFCRAELKVLHGYEVPVKNFSGFLNDIINQTFDYSVIDIARLSKRRLVSLPTAGVILRKIIDHYGIENIIVSSAGIREGVLLDMLTFQRDTDSSALSFAISEANLRARNPLLYPHFSRLIFQILPDLSDRYKLLAEIIIYLSDVAYRRHVDYRAEYIFDFTIYSNLDDLTHVERIIVAAAVAWRYEPDYKIRKAYLDYLDQKDDMLFFARSMGFALRYLYSVTGMSHFAAADLSFERSDQNLIEKTISGTLDALPPEGEMSDKRLSSLLKHLFKR